MLIIRFILKKIQDNNIIVASINFDILVNNLILKNKNMEYKKVVNFKKFVKYCIHEIKTTKFKTLDQLLQFKKLDIKKNDDLNIKLIISNLEQNLEKQQNGENISLFSYNISMDICM